MALRLCKRFLAALLLSIAPACAAADDDVIVLKNEHVQRELHKDGDVWRTVRFSRADGSDTLAVQSDEFHILPLEEKAGFTIDDYKAEAPPEQAVRNGMQSVRIAYIPAWAGRTDALSGTARTRSEERELILECEKQI